MQDDKYINTISLSDVEEDKSKSDWKKRTKLRVGRRQTIHNEMGILNHPVVDKPITNIGGPTFPSYKEGERDRGSYNTNFIDMYKKSNSPYRNSTQRHTTQYPAPPVNEKKFPYEQEAPRTERPIASKYTLPNQGNTEYGGTIKARASYQMTNQAGSPKSARFPQPGGDTSNFATKGEYEKGAFNVDNSFLSDSFKATSFCKNFYTIRPLTPPFQRIAVVSARDYKPAPKPKDNYNYLEKSIENGETEIELPTSRIEIESLIIRRSMRIKGKVGTHLLVSGTISIERGANVEFQECDLELIPGTQTLNELRVISLFSVAKGGALKLVDCHLHSLTFDPGVRKPGLLEDACFWLQPCGLNIPGDNTPQNITSDDMSATLTLVSCSIMNFYTGIISGANSKLHIFQCGMQKCRNSCLLSVNPLLLHITECSFDRCEEIAVEVRFRDSVSQGGLEATNTLSTNPKDSTIAKSEISIESSEIKNIQKAGIAIYSEDDTPVPTNTKIRIESNAIHRNRGEGIYAKDLDIHSFQLLNNEFFSNTGSSIALNNVSVSEGKVICDYNLCNRSCSAYGILAVNTRIDVTNTECLMNTKGGIFIIGGSKSTEEKANEMRISHCNSNDNYEHGIAIIDSPGIVHIYKCKIHKNKEYGVYHSQEKDRYNNPNNPNISSVSHFWHSTSLITPHNPNLHSYAQGLREGTINSQIYYRSKVEIDQCEIKENIKGGIYLNNARLHFHATVIKENPTFAINIPHQETKRILTFSKKSKGSKYLTGAIGGYWGDYKVMQVYYPRWALSAKGHKNPIGRCCCVGGKKKKKVKDNDDGDDGDDKRL